MASPRSVSDASANASADRLATVVEAAETLGITPDAVRSRLRRGTLERSPERGEDGEVLVVLRGVPGATRNADQSGTVGDQSSDQSGDQSATDRDASPTVALVDALQQRIEHLSRIIETRDEEIRRRDTIIMTLSQRIPELEGPSDLHGGERGGPETASEEPDRGNIAGAEQGPKRGSWWRRFFGFEA